MSAAPVSLTAHDVARGLSMFEIDETLEALVEAAEQEAEANEGELSDTLKERSFNGAKAPRNFMAIQRKKLQDNRPTRYCKLFFMNLFRKS